MHNVLVHCLSYALLVSRLQRFEDGPVVLHDDLRRRRDGLGIGAHDLLLDLKVKWSSRGVSAGTAERRETRDRNTGARGKMQSGQGHRGAGGPEMLESGGLGVRCKCGIANVVMLL